MNTIPSTPVLQLLDQMWRQRRAEFESSCRGSTPGSPPPDPEEVIGGLLHQIHLAAKKELEAIRAEHYRPTGTEIWTPTNNSNVAPGAETPNNNPNTTPPGSTSLTLDPDKSPPQAATLDHETALFEPQATASLPSDGTTAPGTPAPPRKLKLPTIPGFAITGVLGHGGMGVVYRAKHLALKREVALKMILKGEHASPTMVSRFLTEARAVASLNNPNIVQIYEINELDGMPYFALEFCTRGSLDRLTANQPQSPNQAAAWTQTLAQALQAAHDADVIHRDLKPANILIAADGVLKVTDFGLARIVTEGGAQTGSGSILGSPSYMPPEQAAGNQSAIGPHSDQYSLGATLYEFLTGRAPFSGPTTMDTIRQVLEVEPVPPTALQPGIPKDLETICLKALSKDASRRYPSMKALADDLQAFQEGRPISARPVGRMEKAWRWAKRNPRVAGLLSAVASLLVVLAVSGAVFTVVYRAKASELSIALEESQKNLKESNANYAFARDVSVTLAQEVPNELRARIPDPTIRLAVVELITRSLFGRTSVDAIRRLPDRMLYTASLLRGDARLARGEYDSALEDYSEALRASEKLIAEDDVERDKADGLYANAMLKLASGLKARALQKGRTPESAKTDLESGRRKADEAVEFQRRRVKSPRSSELSGEERSQNLASALALRAEFDTTVTEALTRLEEAIRIQEGVVSAMSTERLRQEAPPNLARIHYQRAGIYRVANRPRDRRNELQTAIQVLSPFQRTVPNDTNLRATLARWNRELGDMIFLSGDRVGPLPYYQAAHALTRPYVIDPVTIELQQDLAADAYRAGLIALETRQAEVVTGGVACAVASTTAQSHFREAFRRAEIALEAGRDNLVLINLASLAAGRCGELRHALRWAEIAERSTRPNQMIEAACCYAVATGAIADSPEVAHLSVEVRNAKRADLVKQSIGLLKKWRTFLQTHPQARMNVTVNLPILVRRLKSEPDLDAIRREPEFQAFLTDTARAVSP